MTEPLFLIDSYLRSCDSKVLEVLAEGVVLDRTVFYPRGGGQPSDTGTISIGGKAYKVKEALKKEGKIIHHLEGGAAGILPGMDAHCEIDWERRYRLMRMHTAAHVLGSVMFNELGAKITGNQLETDKTRFDFSLAGLTARNSIQPSAKRIPPSPQMPKCGLIHFRGRRP